MVEKTKEEMENTVGARKGEKSEFSLHASSSPADDIAGNQNVAEGATGSRTAAIKGRLLQAMTRSNTNNEVSTTHDKNAKGEDVVRVTGESSKNASPEQKEKLAKDTINEYVKANGKPTADKPIHLSGNSDLVKAAKSYCDKQNYAMVEEQKQAARPGPSR